MIRWDKKRKAFLIRLDILLLVSILIVPLGVALGLILHWALNAV